jgi:hypothetical protein
MSGSFDPSGSWDFGIGIGSKVPLGSGFAIAEDRLIAFEIFCNYEGIESFDPIEGAKGS